MKNISKYLFLILAMFIFYGEVNAATITWQQITDEMKNMLKDEEDYTVTSDDKSLKIDYKQANDEENTEEDETEENETEEDYSFTEALIQFNYDNDVISLVIDDKTNYNDRELALNALFDDIICKSLIGNIAILYDVDPDEIFKEEDLSKYGIIIESNEVKYEVEGVSISAEDITKFTIDLNKFEESTKPLVGTYTANKDKYEGGIVISDPKVSLSLEKANINSLDLIVNVEDLSESSTASCDIYFRTTNDGVTTDGEKAGTIENCVNGQNKINIKNLKEDTEYEFGIVLNEKWIGDNINSVRGNNISFKTIKNVVEKVDNPGTGESYIYIIISFLIISSVIIFFTIKKLNNYNI